MGIVVKLADSFEDHKRIAEFMENTRPEWFSYEGSLDALRADVSTVWYMENEEGIFACAHIYNRYYNTPFVEINNIFYNDGGGFAVDSRVAPLLKEIYASARRNGQKFLIHVITSRSASILGKKLVSIGEELSSLRPITNDGLAFWLEEGFEPIGILPDLYGDLNHGIILRKAVVA
ncbi:MAG: hypothetical protein ACYCYE_02360 [Clostridia bacterium]